MRHQIRERDRRTAPDEHRPPFSTVVPISVPQAPTKEVASYPKPVPCTTKMSCQFDDKKEIELQRLERSGVVMKDGQEVQPFFLLVVLRLTSCCMIICEQVTTRWRRLAPVRRLVLLRPAVVGHHRLQSRIACIVHLSNGQRCSEDGRQMDKLWSILA